MLHRKIDGLESLLEVLRAFWGQQNWDDNTILIKTVEKYTHFAHPEVVSQTQNLPVICARRARGNEKRHSVVGQEFVSDNLPPDYVFRAATIDKRVQGWTQVSHIYPGKAQDVFFYTNLANLCLMPFWLAKLSDTNPNCIAFLKKCSYDLYGFDPLTEFKTQNRDISASQRLNLTTPVHSFFTSLEHKQRKEFLDAKKCGYLFNSSGNIDHQSQWIRSMQNFQNFPK